jgi:chromosomal replication initiation ATPase DnaA
MEEIKTQKVLKLESHDNYELEDYYVSNSNLEAYNAITQEITGIMPYKDIILIQGKKSSGKSFLAKILSRIHNGKTLSKLEDFFGSSVFIVDNAEKIPEIDLFHIFNKSVDNNKKLVLFSNPNWKIKLKDLESRINSIRTIHIKEPDDYLLEVIISKEFSKRSIEVSKDIINYIKSRVDRDFEKISEFIKAFDNFCLVNRRNITIRAVHDYLKLHKNEIAD